MLRNHASINVGSVAGFVNVFVTLTAVVLIASAYLSGVGSLA
jgi:hypothetical protein